MKGIRNKRSQNVLLVKDDVGKSKPTTRPLPQGEHTFGLLGPRDAVDAKGCKF